MSEQIIRCPWCRRLHPPYWTCAAVDDVVDIVPDDPVVKEGRLVWERSDAQLIEVVPAYEDMSIWPSMFIRHLPARPQSRLRRLWNRMRDALDPLHQ